MLAAYGHTCIWIAERDSWRGKSDDWHLENLQYVGADWYLTLDWNRQADVWSAMYGRLAAGTGRLIRIKPRSRELPDIPTLTAYWARAYPRFGPSLTQPSARLIQVGMRIDRQQSEPMGSRTYYSGDIARMVQQRALEHGGQLLRPGRPRLNPPPGPGRPRRAPK